MKGIALAATGERRHIQRIRLCSLHSRALLHFDDAAGSTSYPAYYCHQLIQEYYAAEQLGNMLDDNLITDADLKLHYLNYVKWTETIAMCLELLDNETQAIRVVELAIEVDYLLGARLAGSVKSQFHDKTVELMEKLQIHPFAKIELLGETRSESAVEFLTKALEHEDSDMRWSAAEALGKIGRLQDIRLMRKRLKSTGSTVRVNTRQRLSETGGWEAYAKWLAPGEQGPHAKQSPFYEFEI